MRVEILVRPNASGTSVGGSYDGALVVRVAQPAERGRATAAALDAVAEALGVPRRSIALVHGATGRRKLIEIEPAGLQQTSTEGRLERLLADRAR